MTEIIYVDVLIGLNIFVTWLLLAASVFFSAVRARTWRLLLAALAGGVASLLIFLPAVHWIFLFLLKIGLSAFLVWVAFGYGRWKRFLRCFAAFFAANFVFAGVMLGAWLAIKPSGMFYQNGAIYFDVSLIALVLFAGATYVLVRLLTSFLQKRHPTDGACDVTITAAEQSITVAGFYDSGNQLTDNFTGAPVMVAEYRALESFLPEELRPFFAGGHSYADLPTTHAWRSRTREIPFHAVGGEGLLPAFRSDQVIVKTHKRSQTTVQAIVAVTTDNLADGRFDAVVQAEMLMR